MLLDDSVAEWQTPRLALLRKLRTPVFAPAGVWEEFPLASPALPMGNFCRPRGPDEQVVLPRNSHERKRSEDSRLCKSG